MRPGDRRVNLAIAQIQARGGDGGIVGFERGAGAFDAWPAWRARIRARRRRWCGTGRTAICETTPAFCELGIAGGVGLGEFGLRGVAREGGFGLRDHGLVAADGGFGLTQRVLERARVDDEQQVALFDVLAFGERDALELSGDLRFHLHDRGRVDGPDDAQLGRHGLLGGRGDRDGDNRRTGGRGLCLLLVAPGEQQRSAGNYHCE